MKARIFTALYAGLGFLAAWLAAVGIQVLVWQDYDPLFGSTSEAFMILAAFAFPPSASAALGAFVALLLAPRVVSAHTRRLHTVSAAFGIAVFGLVLALNELRAWFDRGSLLQPDEAEVYGIKISLAFLLATGAFWFILKLLIARNYLIAILPSGGLCESCGYDMTGNTSGRCPECGSCRLDSDSRSAS